MTRIVNQAAQARGMAPSDRTAAQVGDLAWTFERSEGAALVRKSRPRNRRDLRTTANIVWLDD